MLPLDDATFEYVQGARRRIAQNADDADALFVLATWYTILGQSATALRFLDRLTQTPPGYPGAWRLKAYVYRQLGNEAMAARCEHAASQNGG